MQQQQQQQQRTRSKKKTQSNRRNKKGEKSEKCAGRRRCDDQRERRNRRQREAAPLTSLCTCVCCVRRASASKEADLSAHRYIAPTSFVGTHRRRRRLLTAKENRIQNHQSSKWIVSIHSSSSLIHLIPFIYQICDHYYDDDYELFSFPFFFPFLNFFSKTGRQET